MSQKKQQTIPGTLTPAEEKADQVAELWLDVKARKATLREAVEELREIMQSEGRDNIQINHISIHLVDEVKVKIEEA